MNKRKYMKLMKKNCRYCNDISMSNDGIIGNIERRMLGDFFSPVKPFIEERMVNYCPYCGRRVKN